MNLKIEKDKILIYIPAVNDGKFKFKTRETGLNFGESFSARMGIFDKKVYLEWQIGYDATVSDVRAGVKETRLTKESFIGANGKEKYPYELSELLSEVVSIGVIEKKQIINLLQEVQHYSLFIDERKIEVEPTKQMTLNGISFETTSIKLPALFMTETIDGTQIEIHVKQQQYASGTQPMVYFCIPITAFNNSGNLMNRSSVVADILVYEFNNANSKILLDMFKIFAMCSKRHNYDVVQILKLISK